jgi:GntR family transcriptional repressor for pyruvate dehydrogenase complex
MALETTQKSSTGEEFQPLKAQRLSGAAADQLIELIRSGRLAPGTKLPSEREMVKFLGFSRNSYREAIRVLETMGLLHVAPGIGTWVCEKPQWAGADLGMEWLASHERQVFELLEVRDALEVKVVALAAKRASEAQLAGIKSQLDRMRRAVDSEDVEEILAADTAFHAAVAEASGNRVLESAQASLYESLIETRRAMISIPGRLSRMDIEHRAIAEAIFSRDSDAAARTMTVHAARVEREVSVAIHAVDYLGNAV